MNQEQKIALATRILKNSKLARRSGNNFLNAIYKYEHGDTPPNFNKFNAQSWLKIWGITLKREPDLDEREKEEK
jgi:hypothetical protein